ncbi:MAG TPA: head GIN domain-containing protein [Saprospiraceae bacterium]|nr:head GIN domain-containing protein [Saprospiraceae bacterium]HND88939.1 head GIN domain-containing protein [Saprospiraceae bacterium]HNG89538.1 head GIN domain-containing protein [Saprospiraceae bacterium]
MNKTILSLALFLMACLRLAAQTTTTRSLPAFDGISIAGGFEHVYLKEGSAEGIVIEVSGIDADKIKTEVKGSTLEIGVKKGWHGNFKSTLTITYRQIKALSSSGSSDVEALSVLKGDAFAYACSGSGDFKATFEVSKLEASISGSGDMVLKGKAGKQDFSISGSGDIQAHELKGDSAEVSISGSGDVSLQVDGQVRSSVSGSGRVTNKG